MVFTKLSRFSDFLLVLIFRNKPNRRECAREYKQHKSGMQMQIINMTEWHRWNKRTEVGIYERKVRY